MRMPKLLPRALPQLGRVTRRGMTLPKARIPMGDSPTLAEEDHSVKPTPFDRLDRVLTATRSRRAAARTLFGLGAAGTWPLLVDPLDADAGKKKKRKRCKKAKRPFCAGKNVCFDGAQSSRCGTDGGDICYCYITDRGDPFCGVTGGPEPCGQCTAEETCIVAFGLIANCNQETACGLPCANPD